MKRTKVFAAYLPQFHETPENNMFWGDGFTDWVGVKNAKPQYPGHNQPRIPLDNNYYDLSDYRIIQWQANLARHYGVDGFNIYHYWFKNGKQMLQTPAELILKHPEIDIEYFFSWDNCSWVRSWSSIPGNDWAPEAEKTIKDGKEVLLELDYEDRDQWEKHFYYLLPFFKDKRYMKINNCPVFAFMTNQDRDVLLSMGNYWKELAVINGLEGLFLLTQRDVFKNKQLFDAQFLYQPAAASWGKRKAIEDRLQKHFGIKPKEDREVKYFYNYEKVWKKLVRNAPQHIKENLIPGAVIKYDDTPRRGNKAMILHSTSPDIFNRYFTQLYRMCCANDCVMVLLTAWNEWGEGAYLEPDETDGYAYLEALKKAVDSCSE